MRSISLADENAPVTSLVGPQRIKTALLSKPIRNNASGSASSTIPDLAHKSTSSFVGTFVSGRRVLGDVSNAVQSIVSGNGDFDNKDSKIAVKQSTLSKVASHASLAPSDSSGHARSSTDGSSATYGGNASKKLAATLKNRSSAQSLNSVGINAKRKSSSKTSSTSSNPWATVAPKVLREEINEVEVIADHNDQIELDESDQVPRDFLYPEDEVILAGEEQMIVDLIDGSSAFRADECAKVLVNPSDAVLSHVEPDRMVTASESSYQEDAAIQYHSMQSDENELSICRNNVDDSSDVEGSDNWLLLPDDEELAAKQVIEAIRRDFQEEQDYWDATMVAEYSDDIFKYMGELEESTLPNPRYMEAQTEIQWEMRTTLIDWLLQVHMRYHMLPETLWIAVNIIDRFLSKRVVSLVKFQLVGVTAMFVAAKYEEIMAPSVEEFVYMTENGYTRDEILKGEKILLTTLDFRISSYCSPYSWLRRISKADDYDIQTRTLSKFLMELTLLDHRFLRAKSSMIAAIGMYTARRMLGADWSDSFVFYSGYTEAQLITPMTFLIEFLSTDGFEDRFVYKKYANRKFLKASIFARNQALKRVREESPSQEV